MKIVGLSGSHSRPSKSHTVVELVAARAAERMGGKARCFDMIDAGPELGRTFSRASARIEHVKRLLGVAEEMGVEFAPDSLPPAE